jgi:hypothetical protein
MAVNCPQCGNAMSELNATQAQCAKLGPYTILFKRSAEDDGLIPLAESSAPPPRASAAPTTLPYAQQYSYAQQFTPYGQPMQTQPMGPCQNHQQVAAVQRCTRCSARVCSVCDFSFPGDIHLCPRCVTSASGALSPGRKGMMIASYAMAGAGTFFFALLVVGGATGMFAGMGMLAIGIIFIMLVGCIVSGLGMGIGTLDRQQNNTVALWIAACWNGLLALALLLTTVVGLMMKGHR